MIFNIESLTPEKSQIITKIGKKYIERKIKYVNKKGTFKQTKECLNCGFCGRVQLGLGFFPDISCDRDEGYWRMRTGQTDRKCKYFKPKV